MKTGTKSVLFGVHQFILHPLFVLRAWHILYGKRPRLYELCAIITHDLGYLGKPNMDGKEGETHPEVAAAWWRKNFGEKSRFWWTGDTSFGERVAIEILGHSRFHAKANNLPLSKLFAPDKLSTALYPKWLYLLLGNLSGEIHEYRIRAAVRYSDHGQKGHDSQLKWLIEVQSHCALMAIQGMDNNGLKQQMEAKPDAAE